MLLKKGNRAVWVRDQTDEKIPGMLDAGWDFFPLNRFGILPNSERKQTPKPNTEMDLQRWYNFLMGAAFTISRFEGFQSGACRRCRENNNPGAIRTWGQLPVRNGFAVFPTLDQGWLALYRQIALNVNRGLTWVEFFGGKPGVYSGYAPAADNNNPRQYGTFVANKMNMNPDIPILNQLAQWTTFNPS
jgi:hypothetical protein